jgi:hypothetical protein
MKQETLEEAAENYGWRIKRNTFSNAVKANELVESAKQDFIAGAKWQQEQDKKMFTKDDIIEAFYTSSREWSNRYQDWVEVDFNKWFEQFKNKALCMKK